MTPRPDIKPSRRQQLPIAMARSMLSATLMIVVYYALPFDHPLDFRVLVWLGVGLAALAVGLAYQVRAIVVADAPRVRAMETLAIGLPFLQLLYASFYTILAVNEPASDAGSRTGGQIGILASASQISDLRQLVRS